MKGIERFRVPAASSIGRLVGGDVVPMETSAFFIINPPWRLMLLDSSLKRFTWQMGRRRRRRWGATSGSENELTRICEFPEAHK